MKITEKQIERLHFLALQAGDDEGANLAYKAFTGDADALAACEDALRLADLLPDEVYVMVDANRRLRELGAPAWVYLDLSDAAHDCVSNDQGVCGQCAQAEPEEFLAQFEGPEVMGEDLAEAAL